ncbi:MAG: phage tail protein, partial [Bacteroidota bacterium]
FLKSHFSAFFMFPLANVNAAFKTIKGLSFSYTPEKLDEGGVSGYSHNMTNRGSFGTLSLERGFTNDSRLYEWCDLTNMTMRTQPCDILISLLDEQSMPVKNWLVFHAIPTKWSTEDLDSDATGFMMENISLSYRNFMLL